MQMKSLTVTIHVEGVVGVVQVSPVDVELHWPAHRHRHVHCDHLGGLNSARLQWVAISAVNDPSVSQPVFTITEKAPTGNGTVTFNPFRTEG